MRAPTLISFLRDIAQDGKMSNDHRLRASDLARVLS